MARRADRQRRWQEELWRTAVHEAGHAYIAHLFGDPLVKVIIHNPDSGLARIRAFGYKGGFQIWAAGYAAEKVLLGRYKRDSEEDETQIKQRGMKVHHAVMQVTPWIQYKRVEVERLATFLYNYALRNGSQIEISKKQLVQMDLLPRRK